jgi:membrane-associated protein
VAGGVLWILGFTLLGFFFGNIQWVKEHFSVVIVAIVIISVLPMVIEYLRHRKDPEPQPPAPKA